MKTILMITGGSVDLAFASDFIAKHHYEAVMAVDGGLKACDALGLAPDFLLGDFDTVEPALLEQYQNRPGISVVRHKPEKDATDTELAIDYCISLKADEIHILGGSGTRLDHSLSNLYVMLHAFRAGVSCVMFDAWNKAYLLGSGRRLIGKAEQYGDFITLLPVTEQVTGVTLKGFKYPLNQVDFQIGYSLGVSNEITDETAEIQIDQGIFLVVEARD